MKKYYKADSLWKYYTETPPKPTKRLLNLYKKLRINQNYTWRAIASELTGGETSNQLLRYGIHKAILYYHADLKEKIE